MVPSSLYSRTHTSVSGSWAFTGVSANTNAHAVNNVNNFLIHKF